ncbi:MAG: HPr(Ser) kinase/phosphatase [Deltaproteobacteria bacterium]|nr:HPr(Ser) kinase/phosphatase [Deltaproteobacteria bacterium]
MTSLSELSVQSFIDHVSRLIPIELLAGADGLSKTLTAPRIQKPGLALVGYTAALHGDRVQVLGQTEISFLGSISEQARRDGINALLSANVACVLVTKGLDVPDQLLLGGDRTNTPILRTTATSSVCVRRVIALLEDLMAPRSRVHGVLVDVDGVGVLITGSSGIGKSECALDLVLRGHRLVADDVVEVRRRGDDLVGQSSALIRNLIEIRGLGILNVAELFGVSATRDHKRIELHVELEMWRADRAYDRVGLDAKSLDLLGVSLISRLVPVRPGRDVASLVEVAALNFLLKLRGHDAAQSLAGKIDADLERRRRSGVLRKAARGPFSTDALEDEVE